MHWNHNIDFTPTPQQPVCPFHDLDKTHDHQLNNILVRLTFDVQTELNTSRWSLSMTQGNRARQVGVQCRCVWPINSHPSDTSIQLGQMSLLNNNTYLWRYHVVRPKHEVRWETLIFDHRIQWCEVSRHVWRRSQDLFDRSWSHELRSWSWEQRFWSWKVQF